MEDGDGDDGDEVVENRDRAANIVRGRAICRSGAAVERMRGESFIVAALACSCASSGVNSSHAGISEFLDLVLESAWSCVQQVRCALRSSVYIDRLCLFCYCRSRPGRNSFCYLVALEEVVYVFWSARENYYTRRCAAGPRSLSISHARTVIPLLSEFVAPQLHCGSLTVGQRSVEGAVAQFGSAW